MHRSANFGGTALAKTMVFGACLLVGLVGGWLANWTLRGAILGAARPPLGCERQLRSLALAMTMYAMDHDEAMLPPAASWEDALAPYGRSRCPAAAGAVGSGYAFNRWLDGVRLSVLRDPATTPVLFDSRRCERNAADPLLSLDFRHDEGAYVAWADGSVRRVTHWPAACGAGLLPAARR